ncbi:MAG: hypothetical protein CMF59_02640 [Leptospiraceae bacterium]|nr:hypothetical protein [Leptospiraceae bacterium]
MLLSSYLAPYLSLFLDSFLPVSPFSSEKRCTAGFSSVHGILSGFLGFKSTVADKYFRGIHFFLLHREACENPLYVGYDEP